MSKCCLLIVAFLTISTLTVPEVGGVETDPYRKLGSTVELSPGSVDGPISSIEWKHGNDIAVEWYGDNIIEYRQFKGRSTLNMSTGHLIIYNVTSEHSGRYAAEINSKIKDSTSIEVISPVPKPTVSTWCSAEKTHCLLTCEGTITDDNGPVTYIWTVGDMHLTGNKTLHITQENHETLFGCRLENPISSESSTKIVNPLLSRGRDGIIVSVVTVPLIIAVLVAVIVLWRRGLCNRGGWRPPGQADPAPPSRVTETNKRNDHGSEAEREELLTNQQTSAPNGTSGSSPAPEEPTPAGPETKVTVHQEDTEEPTPAGPETKVTVHQEDSSNAGPQGKEDTAEVQN